LEDFAQSNPESEKPRKRRALDEATIDPKHARVRNHLAAYLDKKGVKHTNERINGWGPDLIALLAKPILFESKQRYPRPIFKRGWPVCCSMKKILERPFRKILLLPSMPKPSLVAHLREFDVDVLTRYLKRKGFPNFFPRKLGSNDYFDIVHGKERGAVSAYELQIVVS